MILYDGAVYPSEKQDEILSELGNRINYVRSHKSLSAETVISALDKLSQKIEEGAFSDLLAQINIVGIEKYVNKVSLMLKREAIEYKITCELGADSAEKTETNPPFYQAKIGIRHMPLGTLLHIAAGNVDGLPAYSVVEGLVTGNVNILKLPQVDKGLSIEIIMKLIEIEPLLADFIYVFDTPSTDITAIKKMAEISDGIVVWGGNEAISAVRRYAPIGAKLIEWGHKLSFAYISGYSSKEHELSWLAEHILSTKQLLCSSCQVIYIDSECMEDVYKFCEDFLPVMERVALNYSAVAIGEVAENTLRRYSSQLEKYLLGMKKNGRQFQGMNCSLTACEDMALELSDMFGNCLVKRLPQCYIVKTLRESKDYLQTVGLICEERYRAELVDVFSKCGLTRITKVKNMSENFCGESHDGEYPLRRYTRVVNIEL